MEDNGKGYLLKLLELTDQVTCEKFDSVFQIDDMTIDAAFVGSAGELISKINTSNIEAHADKLPAELDHNWLERVLELIDDPRKLQAAMMLPGSDRAVVREAIDRIAACREIEHSRRMHMFKIAVAEAWIEAKDIEVSYPEIQDIIQSAVHSELVGTAKIEQTRLTQSEESSDVGNRG